MRYRVCTYSMVGEGASNKDRPDVETWFDDPAEAAFLYMNLLAQDPTAPRSTGFRLLTCMLEGSRSFGVLSGRSYYKIEAVP